MSVVRCSPLLDSGIIRVKKIGEMTELTFRRTSLAKGVDTKAVHRYNVASGVIPESEIDDTAKEREKRSRHVSAQASISAIRELIACNPWKYFVTITLSPDRWDRQNPSGLQKSIKDEATAWRRKMSNKENPYADYSYLMIPELHKDGGVHLHGFVNLIPDKLLAPYTMDDAKHRKLPKYILDTLRAGRTVYHCTEWDEKYGYNLLEPIIDLTKAANYATKYVTKDLGDNMVFKSRYWCSRGLKRAETISIFRSSISDDAMNAYSNLVLPLAAITSKGEVLHRECYSPQNMSPRPVGYKTIIDSSVMSTQEVCSLLAAHYPSDRELRDSRGPYDYMPESLRTLADHCNDAHDGVLYERAQPQLFDVDDDGELPF